jgi:hypothetical protein
MTAYNSLCIAIVLWACAGMLELGRCTAADGVAAFKITTRRADDRVEVKVEGDKATFVVHSPFGISHAIIERSGAGWPAAMRLKLHLKGLEHFRIASGKVTLEGSAAIQDGHVQLRLWKDRAEDAPLDAKSPYWIDVRILDSDGKPAKAMPLNDGTFEFTIPKALLADNPKSITIGWIDFYR